METNLKIDGSCLPPVLFLIAFGVYFFYQGYKTGLFFIALGHRGQSTKGRVLGLREEVTGNSPQVNHTYPLFSYQVNGQWYEVEGDELVTEHFRIGQEMVVRFLPENPVKFTWRKTGLVGLGSLLFGLSLTTVGVWVLAAIFG